MRPAGRHAVVIGGSIAGTAAAQTLSSRFENVTVIDRDAFPDSPRSRRGVPQSEHAHGLLISGRIALDELFPQFTDELVNGGAVPFDPGTDVLFFQMGGFRARIPTGMLGVSASRAFLEHRMRRRIEGTDNVRIRDGLTAQGLTAASGRVTGLELSNGETLPADLVVNATGRNSGRLEKWLAQLGCAAPDTASVRINVRYTTRIFHRVPGDDLHKGGLFSVVAPHPPGDGRAAALAAIEGDRWMVTLGGWHGAEAPTDLDGFRQFAAELPHPHVAELLARAEPIGDAHTYQTPTAQRRYFERLRVVPSGFVALGDAICSFNPVYGQGMTVALLEARELGHCLDRFGTPSEAMAREYYRRIGKVIDTPWQMATGGDFMFPQTTGRKPRGTDLVNRYARQVMLASQLSPELHLVLLRMQHLLDPPTAMFRPGTVLRTLRTRRATGTR
ncbi:hypothetical protein JNW91_05715 [Micromonospora sp. STR1_7]|uniref:Uncharacterized protein n=1 Tax=Micromonospora parastrephiae TaxID=2806101 RepID=A0ABS1XQ69_9ACTN|nr:hypothetical protein [Micromonospora parastrephiae]MBM0231406.1 hypothetical protein [Micromonospora parastrephiae]